MSSLRVATFPQPAMSLRAFGESFPWNTSSVALSPKLEIIDGNIRLNLERARFKGGGDASAGLNDGFQLPGKPPASGCEIDHVARLAFDVRPQLIVRDLDGPPL